MCLSAEQQDPLFLFFKDLICHPDVLDRERVESGPCRPAVPPVQPQLLVALLDERIVDCIRIELDEILQVDEGSILQRIIHYPGYGSGFAAGARTPPIEQLPSGKNRQ